MTPLDVLWTAAWLVAAVAVGRALGVLLALVRVRRAARRDAAAAERRVRSARRRRGGR